MIWFSFLPVVSPTVVAEKPFAGLLQGKIGTKFILCEGFSGDWVDGFGVDGCDDGGALV